MCSLHSLPPLSYHALDAQSSRCSLDNLYSRLRILQLLFPLHRLLFPHHLKTQSILMFRSQSKCFGKETPLTINLR